MKRLPVACIAAGAIAMIVTAGIVTSSDGDDSDRIEVGAPTSQAGPTLIAPSTTVDLVSTTAAPPIVDLRAQRWDEVIARDPNLSATPHRDGTTRYRYVGPNAGTSTFAVEPAIVMTADVSFADVGGDGFEEAFLPVVGSHGPFTVLVYYATSAGPRLAEADEPFWSAGGWTVGGRTESYEVRGGHILRTAGLYSGFDLGCCPSSRVTTTYALVGHRLVEAQPPIVVAAEQGWASASSRLVTSIAGGRYDDAYSLFGPTVRAEMSIDQWRQRFAAARVAFVEIEHSKDGRAVLTLIVVEQRGNVLGVRQQRGDVRFGYHAEARRWLIDEFALHDTPYIAPAPKAAFVQGAFDVVSIDENAKTALVLLTCTAPADTSITIPSLITVALADAHLRLNATDPLATFAEWAAAVRTYRHWRFNILPTESPPSTARTTYVSLDPTNNLNTCP